MSFGVVPHKLRDAPLEARMAAAARHDPPDGATFKVSPETLESCAAAAERVGDVEQAAWLRALANNQRRLERQATRRGYRIDYRRRAPAKKHAPRVRRSTERPQGTHPRRTASTTPDSALASVGSGSDPPPPRPSLLVTKADLDDEGLNNLVRLLRVLDECDREMRKGAE